jgi:hypothetical protein
MKERESDIKHIFLKKKTKIKSNMKKKRTKMRIREMHHEIPTPTTKRKFFDLKFGRQSLTRHHHSIRSPPTLPPLPHRHRLPQPPEPPPQVHELHTLLALPP